MDSLGGFCYIFVSILHEKFIARENVIYHKNRKKSKMKNIVWKKQKNDTVVIYYNDE